MDIGPRASAGVAPTLDTLCMGTDVLQVQDLVEVIQVSLNDPEGTIVGPHQQVVHLGTSDLVA